MALITCPECKKEVSDRALSCPSCAYPLEQAVTFGETGKKRTWFKLASLGAILAGIMVAFSATLSQGGPLAGFLISGGSIGLLSDTKFFVYLLAVYWGVVLGFMIFLIP